MRIGYHPEFASDLRRFASGYGEISAGLEVRFRREVDNALAHVKADPTSAGHFLNTGSVIVPDIRRRNLISFPFFVLYGVHADWLVFGSLIPSRSDPLTWLGRFGPGKS